MIRSIRFLLPKKNEGSVALAEKVLTTMELLRTLNSEMYKEWYCGGNSREQALKNNFSFNINFIEQTILNNWNKKFPDLGSHFGWWNGKEDDFSCAITFTLGMTNSNENMHNVWTLTMPYDKMYYNKQINSNLIKEIENIGKKIWMPLEIKKFKRE
jgi:hypothetical protein